MYPVSDAFKTEIQRSHTSTARADLYVQSELAVSNIPVVQGSITEDVSALIRGRCSVELAGVSEVLSLLPEIAPVGASLWPLGNELRISAGVVYKDGTTELVPQGVFRINKPRLSDSGADVGVIIEGYDRARSVSRYKFTQPYLVLEGTNYATAIKEIIRSRLPFLVDDDFEFMTTTFLTPKLIFVTDDDPWEQCQLMAASIGAELYWGNTGKCVLRPQPDPQFTDPSWNYVEGETATLLQVDRELDDERAFNGVILTSENSTVAAPIRAEAWDTNPDSVTYFDPAYPNLSKYGAYPDFISTQLITTQDQANTAAHSALVKRLGIIEHVHITAINNPAHQANDIVEVTRSTVNLNNIFLFNSVTKGLGFSQDTSAVCRSRRVVA